MAIIVSLLSINSKRKMQRSNTEKTIPDVHEHNPCNPFTFYIEVNAADVDKPIAVRDLFSVVCQVRRV